MLGSFGRKLSERIIPILIHYLESINCPFQLMGRNIIALLNKVILPEWGVNNILFNNV